MKILMVGNSPSVKGGISSVINHLLNHDWRKDGVNMTFIPTYIEATTIRKIVFFAGAYKKIRSELINNRPDIVHIHMSYKGSFYRKYLVHRLCKKFKIADIIHLHGSEFQKWYDESDRITQKKIKRLLNEADAFIVLGQEMNATVKKIEPMTNTIVMSNTIKIPNGCVQWNDNKFQFLFLGVLIERKGVSDLIKAIKILKDTNRTGRFRFVIAGTGPQEEVLKKQAENYGVDHLLEFVGWATGEMKDKLFLESQALILPSYNEGLPVSILEAISYGMPVVATNVGDISSAVHDAENGYLIEPGDIEALTQRLVRISEEKSVYLRMTALSKMIATEQFADEKYYKQLYDCYMKIIGAEGGGLVNIVFSFHDVFEHMMFA